MRRRVQLSRQHQQTLLGGGRRGPSTASLLSLSSWVSWLRNPLVCSACTAVLTVLLFTFPPFSQSTHPTNLDLDLDTTSHFLKGSSTSVLGGAPPSSTAEDAAATLKKVVPSTTTNSNTKNINTKNINNNNSFDLARNAQQIQEWRSQTETSCRNMMTNINNNHQPDGPAARNEKEKIEREAISKLRFPPVPPPSSTSPILPPDDHHQPPKYQYCRNVFIDLGTNIGDSIGYFVDSALDVCSPIWMEQFPRTKFNADFPRPHLDVTTLEIVHKGAGNNPLYKMLQATMSTTTTTTNSATTNAPPDAAKSTTAAAAPSTTSSSSSSSSSSITPNSFCVYGMEGNPEFTQRLQKLENHVMQTQPRPVEHLHIHTESVVTAVDGPTKLFLDKTSVEQNFWGSSILSSQQDAVKSAQELGGGNVFSANVQGISLSTLTKNTVLAYKPGATPEETKGGLLIIKMDVEGAEYQVLKESAASGVLCDYIQKGNRVVMIVEFHNMSITDPAERKREKEGSAQAKQMLEECGVEFGKLQAFWA